VTDEKIFGFFIPDPAAYRVHEEGRGQVNRHG
jgi:hypothetical protein